MTRLAIVLVVLLTAGTAMAKERGASAIGGSDRHEIARVILGQMAAFKAGNFDAAFAFAAPSVREKFVSPDRFVRTVRDQYLPVYNPRSVRFGALTPSAMGPVQHVFVLDPNAVAFVALYLMERSEDGRWRIAGCLLIPAEAREA